MMDLLGNVGGMANLNKYNYRTWNTYMKSYLEGQDLWEIVDGNEITLPMREMLILIRNGRSNLARLFMPLKLL